MRKGVISYMMKLPRNTTFYGVCTLLNHKKRFYNEYIVALSQENALSSALEYICSIDFIIVTDTSLEIIWNLELVTNKEFYFIIRFAIDYIGNK